MKFRKSLTDTAIKAFKAGEKDYKKADGGGLYLLVTTTGAKYWRGKYRVGGVEKKGSYGTYPAVKLDAARKAHEAARDQAKAGNNPVEVKRKDAVAKKVERTKNRPFSEIAQEWIDELIKPLFGDRTVSRYKSNIKVLNKAFGKTLIGDVRLPHLSEVLLRYQRQHKHETRRRIQQCAVAITTMATSRGYIEINHFLGATFGGGYTSPEAVRKSRPAVTDPFGFATLLCDIERAPGLMRRALRLLALTMVRPGELAQQEWTNIKWKQAKMIIPFSTLKMRTERKDSDAEGRDLEVPLAPQTILELQALFKLTGEGKYLFPAQSDKNKMPFVSEEMVNKALHRLDYMGIHCAHGFRSSASTMLNKERVTVKTSEGKDLEVLRWPYQKALIEVQLDHNDASTQAIYDRGGHWEERVELMQLWADRIDAMRAHGGSTKLRLAA